MKPSRLYAPVNKAQRFQKPPLSLEEFLFRQQVLATYRRALRAIYKSHEKQDLLAFVKAEFKPSDASKELLQRRYELKKGTEKMEAMFQMMGMGESV
ncbi:hypothetical protein QA089_002643 [Meyerozyma guilliermondii]